MHRPHKHHSDRINSNLKPKHRPRTKKLILRRGKIYCGDDEYTEAQALELIKLGLVEANGHDLRLRLGLNVEDA